MSKKIISIYLMVSIIAALLMALHAAVYVTFLLNSGLSFFQVSLVNLFYMVFVFLLEIPTGAIADLWGRKMSFVLSSIINGIGFFLYSLAESFLGFVSAEIIIALGTTLTSGALKAWLVDSLQFYNWNGKLVKVFQMEGRLINVAKLLGGVVGAYLGVKNLSTPFALAGIGYWFLAIISSILMKEEYFKKNNNKKNVFASIKEIGKESIIYGFQDNIVFLIISVSVILTISFQSMNMYWQPKYEPFLFNSGQLGFIWAGIIISCLIGNEMVSRLWVSYKNHKTPFLVIGLFAGVMIFFAGFFPGLVFSLIFFFGHEIARGAYHPYTNAVLHENIPSNKRAFK